MASQNLFDLILSDAPVDPQPTAQYQVTTSIVSTPRASDDNILPEPSAINADNNNTEGKSSWDLSAFEAPQPSVTMINSSEKQQAPDDLSDFFGTPVPASTPQQRDSPNPQHSPQKKGHVNDHFFSENFEQSPKEISQPKTEPKPVHEPHPNKESPPITKQNNNQSPVSSNADPHVSAKEVKKEDNKPAVNKPVTIDNETLNKFVKELDDQYSNNMKKILAIMRDNASQTKEIVIDKCHGLADSNQQLERRLKELEEQNKQLVTAVKNLQSQNKTLVSKLSKYEDVSQLDSQPSFGAKIIGFFTGK